MNSHFQAVGDFHLKFDLPVCNGGPESTVIDTELFLFRMDLIIEESAEILRAYRKKDVAGVADGIGDLLYVCYGFLHYLDQPPHLVRGAFASNVYSVADLTEQPDGFMMYLGLIHGHIRSCIESYRMNGATKNLGVSVQDIIMTAYEMAHELTIPIDLVFQEIQRANMSKERSTGDGDGRSTRGSKFDVVKPANFVPPRIQEVLDGAI